MVNTNNPEQSTDRTDCANCGTPIDRNEWHPVRATTECDEFRIYAFCSERCRESWSGPNN